MKIRLPLPLLTIIIPVLAWVVYWAKSLVSGNWYLFVLAAALVAAVMMAVHHAEIVAHRVGEPFGTLLLAIAITVIEVSLIVSLMLAGGPGVETLARDTVFAAVMILLTGVIGLSLLLGGIKFNEQKFGVHGVSAALVTLVAICVLTLILPNYTTSVLGPVYDSKQLVFISLVCLVLYFTFVRIQTVRHRDYFLPPAAEVKKDEHAEPPTLISAILSAVLLVICLGAVVLLAKSLSPALEAGVSYIQAPKATVGVIVATIILLPEGLAAIRAARKNRLQTSLNLSLGSALASIGLTIPAVSIVSLATGMTVSLGIDTKSTLLLFLSLFTILLSFGTGRTTLLQGVVLLVIFAVYLFTTVFP